MNVQDGLDELRQNLLRDDARLSSGPDDRLWSDDTLIRYWNDAIHRFARKTLTLRDSTTPEVVEVVLRTGVTQYTLHPSVRSVISARFDTSEFDMRRLGHSALSDARMVRDDDDWPIPPSPDLWPSGPSLVFSTDESLDLEEQSAVILRLWPAPAVAQNGLLLHLRVARMPLCELSLTNLKAYPELPVDYHLDTLEWVAYRAFRTSDIDGSSDKAQQHKDRFEEAIQEALKDLRRKLFTPTTWGFGRSGFVWSR